MTRPRENPKKTILKKFSDHAIFKKWFLGFFSRQMTRFSAWLKLNFFGPYESINTLEALFGDFGDFDFGHETEFSTLTEMINFQVF